jgi:hypothetical protein
MMDKNLGRWSGFTLSTNFTSEIHILTVYQSVVSDGLHSAYKQQQHQLQQLGKKNPDPRKILLEDLQHLVEEWNKKGDQTIILIDANDNIYAKGSLLPEFLSKPNMTSLIHNPWNHPATHTRGSKCIDYIFGSSSLLPYITAAGINSFYDNPYPNTDHRGLFVDIEELPIFGANLNTLIPPIPRKIVNTSKHLIIKFLQ